MRRSNSTQKRRSRKVSKPPKPYPDFPLTPHPRGMWQKKIRGKIHYFGRWGRMVDGKMQRLPGDGWKEAVELYRAQADDLHVGRTPRHRDPEGLTLRIHCNQFLGAKLRKKAAGELTEYSFQELRRTTDQLIELFGRERLVTDLAAEDFGNLRAEIAKKWGPVRLANEITRVKSVFKFAWDNGLIEKPVRYGSEFQKPGKAVLRRHKAQNGKKTLEADEIRKLLNEADPPMRAMILLGVNCAFGNSDIANLQQSMIEGDWINYPRPKTGIGRRCPLWPETVEAIEAAISERPKPKSESNADCVFLTSHGKRWVRATKDAKTDAVSVKFRKHAKALGVHRPGIGFYSLRHVFQSVGDGARDPVAVKMVMGHADASMSGHYREFVRDENLVRVSNYVRGWLFGKGSEA